MQGNNSMVMVGPTARARILTTHMAAIVLGIMFSRTTMASFLPVATLMRRRGRAFEEGHTFRLDKVQVPQVIDVITIMLSPGLSMPHLRSPLLHCLRFCSMGIY